jgi:nucleotide-binding universal stress UspA family protein
MNAEPVSGLSTLVVGADDSPEALDALHLAGKLHRETGADLHVAAVLADATAGPAVDPEEIDSDAHFERLFQTVSDELSAPFKEHRVVGQSAPSGLTEVAELVDASAIVIGSSARGRIGRVLMGDVGSILASGLEASLIVAPREYASEGTGSIRKVGIGFNGSHESHHALEHGLRLAASLGAKATLIGAIPVPAGGRFAGGAGPEDSRQETTGIEERLSGAAAEAGEDVGYDARHGDAADCLAEASSGYDLLVLSSRGYGPLRRVMMGSVTLRVMRASACPVLVIPRGHDPA